MRKLLVLICALTPLVSRASFDFRKSLDAKRSCEQDLGAGPNLRDQISNLLDMRSEASLYLHLSTLEGTEVPVTSSIASFLMAMQFGTRIGSGSGLIPAGVSVSFGQDRIEFRIGGQLELSLEPEEPISDIRFASDKDLEKNAEISSGYISVIGWSHTRYFRLEKGQIREVLESHFESEIQHDFTEANRIPNPSIQPARFFSRLRETDLGLELEQSTTDTYIREILPVPLALRSLAAAEIPVDEATFTLNPAYRHEKISEFNARQFRLAPDLPILNSEAFTENIRMAQSSRPVVSPIRRALGELAEQLRLAGEDLCGSHAEGIRPIGSGSLPRLLMRMGVYALGSLPLRDQLIEVFNDHQPNLRLFSAPREETTAEQAPTKLRLRNLHCADDRWIDIELEPHPFLRTEFGRFSTRIVK